jgi:hypothetical protein
MKAHKNDSNDTRLALLEQLAWNTREELAGIRGDIKELRRDIVSIRSEIKADFADIRSEMKADFKWIVSILVISIGLPITLEIIKTVIRGTP